MKSLSKLLLIVGVLALATAACSSGGTGGAATQEASALQVGDPAPDFDLPTADGGHVRLSDFRGEKPALLFFSMGPG